MRDLSGFIFGTTYLLVERLYFNTERNVMGNLF